MSKTTMELDYWYKYVSKMYNFSLLLSIVGGHISHLMTVNTHLYEAVAFEDKPMHEAEENAAEDQPPDELG